ncbi:hypothetical protein [Haloferula sp. BvORR071]|uniref:hypothetical protein n=1 Tax=Haloferula sp. BvORR071 TaxID=1396141 RepID=UPI00054F021F|nr:hypothetical protein [Haloferula sp. BvORR071]
MAYLWKYLPDDFSFGDFSVTRTRIHIVCFLLVLAGSSAFNGWLIASTEGPEGGRRALMIWATVGNLLIQSLLAVIIYQTYLFILWI